jgi:hypothetical protein
MGLLIKLQNGDTALKSLKFGKDRPGGGDSGQPYITGSLINDPLLEDVAPVVSGLQHKDFLLRGGINAPVNAADDVKRLTSYMFDTKSPSGLLFIAKQNLLSRTAPKTEKSGIINEGLYTPLKTLAQAGVGFLGVHLTKQGLIRPRKYEKTVYNNNWADFDARYVIEDIEDLQDKGKKLEKKLKRKKEKQLKRQGLYQAENEKIVQSDGTIAQGRIRRINRRLTRSDRRVENAQENIDSNNQKLADLNAEKDGILSSTQTDFNNRLLSLWNDHIISINPDDPTVLSYSGGPGSTLGIGRTRIRFATDGAGNPIRTGQNNPQLDTNQQAYLFGRGKYSLLYNWAGSLYTGASDYEGLTLNQIGYGMKDKTKPFYFAPSSVAPIDQTGFTSTNFTLSKYNPTGKSLTGKNGYLSGLKNSNTDRKGMYNGNTSTKIPPYKTQDKVNYANLLGASIKQGLSLLQNDILDDDGGFGNRVLFGPQFDNATLSKIVKTITGSYGESIQTLSPGYIQDLYPSYIGKLSNKIYGNGKPPSNSSTNFTYSRPYLINNNNVYSNPYLTGQSKTDINYTNNWKMFPVSDALVLYGSQNVNPIQFDVYQPYGTWYSTKTLNEKTYSSYPTLKKDITGSSNPQSWKEYNKFYGYTKGNTSHKEGYLANLNRNVSITLPTDGFNGRQLPQITTNTYPNGIAPDFRLIPREIRMLPSFTTLQAPSQDQYNTLNDLGPLAIPNKEVSTVYHDENGDLKSNTIERIYYTSNGSSFKHSNNTYNGSKDIIPFSISVVNPENQTLTSLTFRAYIDSFSDSYDAEWKSQIYMGRAEKFYKYNSFGRDISLSFTVAADNKDMLDSIYSHLNNLASSLAPTYTTSGYMAGNLHTLYVGNYIDGQTGIIQGLTYEIMDESPWDLDKKLPFYIKVSGLKFTPIQSFRPEYGKKFINS